MPKVALFSVKNLCASGKAVAICISAFLTGEPYNDATTRIQETDEKGTVRKRDHLQRHIARRNHLSGRFRHTPGRPCQARACESRERPVRRGQEGRAASGTQ